MIQHLDGDRQSRPLARQGRAAAVRAHIEATGLRCPNLPELAHTFGLTAKTLNTDFIEAYGMSVSRFIREHRLSIAHEQLQNTDVPLRELCERLGYSHVSNFSSTFKAFFGYSPTALRQKVTSRPVD